MPRCYIGLEVQTFGDYGPPHEVRARVEQALREHFDPDFDGDIVVDLVEYARPHAAGDELATPRPVISQVHASRAKDPVISHLHRDRAAHDDRTIARAARRRTA